ncbi:MAG TPA: GNAT family N-acetyltransferase [Lunatimonas sp.]|nr:GNAT family N-acetyltransferase [Lunatimonas sp.]
MLGQFPILKTERLLLRQIVDGDLENIFKGLSHPDVIRYYGVSYDTLEGTKDQMKFFSDLQATEEGIWWAVCSVDDLTFYGSTGFNNLIKAHKKAEIGCWLLPEYWGRGIMPEAMQLILNYGFTDLGLHRIEGFVETENKNCKKALEKLNFQLEGTMRNCEIKDGRFISLDIYAKLRG